MYRIFCATIIAVILLVSCSTDEKKPSEDSIIAVETFKIIEGVRDAYVRKNFSALHEYFTDDEYSNIIRDIKRFQSVELDFSPTWVDIKLDGKVMVEIEWIGKWSLDGTVVDRRGVAVFEFQKKPLLINRIEKSNPLIQPV